MIIGTSLGNLIGCEVSGPASIEAVQVLDYTNILWVFNQNIDVSGLPTGLQVQNDEGEFQEPTNADWVGAFRDRLRLTYPNYVEVGYEWQAISSYGFTGVGIIYPDSGILI